MKIGLLPYILKCSGHRCLDMSISEASKLWEVLAMALTYLQYSLLELLAHYDQHFQSTTNCSNIARAERIQRIIKKIHRLLHKAKVLPPHKRCCFLPHEYLASVNMRATSCIWTWGFQTCLQNPRSTSHVLPGRKATILLLSQLPATPFSTSRQSKSRRREVLVHWSEVYQDNKRFANLVVFIARRRPCQTEKTQHLGFKEFPQDSNQLCSPLWLLIHVLQKSTGWGNLLQSH